MGKNKKGKEVPYMVSSKFLGSENVNVTTKLPG